MRINKYLASSTPLSRRGADQAIAAGRVTVNGQPAQPGQEIGEQDIVTVDSRTVRPAAVTQTILLHKPVGVVVSRDGQGSKTIYDLLPPELQHLQPVGRLDKDSSGLLLLTNDGALAHQLTHPSFQKTKVYEVGIDKPLQAADHQQITHQGVELADGPSKLDLQQLQDARHWQVTMHEGRNRQIRRTFAALGYDITRLHRTAFGSYRLTPGLLAGQWTDLLLNRRLNG